MRIENYKNKSNMEINKKQWQKWIMEKGQEEKTKKKKVNTCDNKTSP